MMQGPEPLLLALLAGAPSAPPRPVWGVAGPGEWNSAANQKPPKFKHALDQFLLTAAFHEQLSRWIQRRASFLEQRQSLSQAPSLTVYS